MKNYRKLIVTGVGLACVILAEIIGSGLTTEAHHTIRVLAGAFAAGNGLEWIGSSLAHRRQPDPG